MWQTILILFLLAGVLVYVVRHYVKLSRSGGSVCSGCTGCCGTQAGESKESFPEKD
jgi:hypothetical protein